MALRRRRRPALLARAPTGERLSGGLSNEIWKVTDEAGTHVVRFGRDYPFHHVDRAREVMTARAAHAAGFGPAVRLCRAGRHGGGLHRRAHMGAGGPAGATPSASGGCCADFHREHGAGISGAGLPVLALPRRARLRAHPAAGTSPITHRLPGLLDLSRRDGGAQVPLPIVFGHHDLLPANFLDDGTRLWLIDYEYAGFGTALFDLAGAASNAGMPPERDRGAAARPISASPPDAAFRRAFDAMQCASAAARGDVGHGLRPSPARRASTIAPMPPRTSARLDAALDALPPQMREP